MGTVYTPLSMQERRRIEGWWHAKVPVAEMARVLKRISPRSFARSNVTSGLMTPFPRSMLDTSAWRLIRSHNGGDTHNAS